MSGIPSPSTIKEHLPCIYQVHLHALSVLAITGLILDLILTLKLTIHISKMTDIAKEKTRQSKGAKETETPLSEAKRTNKSEETSENPAQKRKAEGKNKIPLPIVFQTPRLLLLYLANGVLGS